MPTATAVWHFVGGIEDWQVGTGGATGITYGYRSTDTAPNSGGGCLYVRRDGQNLQDGYIQVRRPIDFAAIGIPSNAIITRLSGQYYARCSDANSPGASYSSDIYFWSPRFGITVGGGLRVYSGTTSWMQHQPYQISVNCLATDVVHIIFELNPKTDNQPGAYVELRADYVTLSVDYVLPHDEPTTTPSVVIIGSSNTDITSYVRAESIQINRESNGKVSTAKFSACSGVLNDPLQSLLAAGTRVKIASGSTTLFDGEISDIEISTTSRATTYHVTVRDAVALLERTAIVNKTWTSTTVGAIVADLVQNYSAGSISTETGFIVDQRQVSSFSAQADSVAGVLRSLANAYPSAWYLDVDRKLHWRNIAAPEVSGRSYYLTGGLRQQQALVDSLVVSTDMGRLANHVTVIASYDSVSSFSWSANPPATGDDGYLSGSSYSWPPSSASFADTVGSQLIVRAANVAPSTDLIINYASKVTSLKAGDSWPPAASVTPTTDYIESSYYGIPPYNYQVQCNGFVFNTPNRSDPILQTQILITLSNVIDTQSDQQNSVWIEIATSSNYNQATAEPSGTYYTVQLSTGSYAVPVPNVQWNSTVYYRVGIRSGTPAGINRAQITQFQLLVTYQDISSSQYQESRALLRFDTSPLPDDANITSASLKLYAQSLSIPYWATLQLHSVNPSIWPINTSDWSASTTLIGSVGVTSGWNTFSLPPSSISKTGYSAFMLRFSQSSMPQSLSEAYVSFLSRDSSSNKPLLVVDYTAVTPGTSAVAQDSQSQSSYGVRKLVIARPGVSQSECQKIANEELGKRAWPTRSVKFSASSGHGLMPGQIVFLSFQPYVQEGFYVARAVSARLTAAGWRYEVEMIGGEATLETYILEVIR